MSRAIDLLITYRVIKMLVTPFEKTEAYKLGIIDKNGKVLRKNKTLTVAKEKDSYTILHRFVFNLKRILKNYKLLFFVHLKYQHMNNCQTFYDMVHST